MRRAVLAIALAACSTKSASSACPAVADIDHPVVVDIDGAHMCGTFLHMQGMGVAGDGTPDWSNNLLSNGLLANYPPSRRMGIVAEIIIRAGGDLDYTISVGIGGLVRGQWVAPLTESVLPGESSYAATLHPDREGAYVSAIRAETFADHWQTEAGTVTFTTVDLADKHFAGSFQVELESEKGGERHHLAGSFAN